MLIFASAELIQKQELNFQDPSEVSACFDRIGHDKMIDLGNHLYLTYRQFLENKPPVDLRIPYGPDMFRNAYTNIIQYDYAIASDTEGNPKAVIKQANTSYMHKYTCAGEPDPTFLNQYDCICLFGCNEYSVEICKTILPFWQGQRLILYGPDWNDLVEYLPDLPELECFYDPAMTDGTLLELTAGMHTLFATVGIPHQEPMSRYEKGMLYYDEIMALTFLFSDLRKMGEAHPDKHFFVLDVAYDNVGLFTLFSKITCIARYVKSRNRIPVIHLTKSIHSMYSDYPGDEIWSKFYEQPEGYTMEDISDSKHVCFSPLFYSGNILCHIMEEASGAVSLAWPNGIYCPSVLSLLKEKQGRFLPFPDHTLGVLARGTDYVNTKLPSHAIHASLDQLFEKIDSTMEERSDLQYLYVATEDAVYLQKFREKYQNRLYCTDQKRFQTKDNEKLAVMHRNSAEKPSGYELGTDYILSIYLLSQCRALIASGGCAGLHQALEDNAGKWKSEDIYIFNLGYHPG